jgi:hypothetical protein
MLPSALQSVLYPIQSCSVVGHLLLQVRNLLLLLLQHRAKIVIIQSPDRNAASGALKYALLEIGPHGFDRLNLPGGRAAMRTFCRKRHRFLLWRQGYVSPRGSSTI